MGGGGCPGILTLIQGFQSTCPGIGPLEVGKYAIDELKVFAFLENVISNLKAEVTAEYLSLEGVTNCINILDIGG